MGADSLPAGRAGRRARVIRGAFVGTAFAAAALLLVLLLPRDRGPVPGQGLALRSGARESAAESWSVGPAAATPDGGWRFTWPARPGADRYRVLVYGPDLAELAAFSVPGDSVLTVPPEGAAALAGDAATIVWRVEAYAGDELLLVSRPLGLSIP
jgi:hypothetical protein